MSEIDKSNIDAMYWAEKFCERFGTETIDEDLMLGWFANYRFAVADPMTAEIEALKARVADLEEGLFDQLNDCINFDGGKLTDCIMQQSSALLQKPSSEGES
jgi:hypothetical protein